MNCCECAYEAGVKAERGLRELINRDQCADEEKIRVLARPILGDYGVDGDSNAVPDMVEIVQRLVWHIEARAREEDLRIKNLEI